MSSCAAKTGLTFSSFTLCEHIHGGWARPEDELPSSCLQWIHIHDNCILRPDFNGSVLVAW